MPRGTFGLWASFVHTDSRQEKKVEFHGDTCGDTKVLTQGIMAYKSRGQLCSRLSSPKVPLDHVICSAF